jgi:tetratricopeptide (TPR) repeat protein
VRSRSLDKARKIEARIAPLVDEKSFEQHGYFHLLRGEIALAQEDSNKAIELLTLSNKEKPTSLSAEALARAYQLSGRTNEAITAYEEFMALENGSLLWEPQQEWLAAYSVVASDYLARDGRDNPKKSHAIARSLEGCRPGLNPTEASPI